MTARSRFVAALLRVYPPGWRTEYGPELAEILERQPLDVRIVAGVLSSAVRQRVRVAEPATWCGVAAMVVVAVGVGLNIAGLPAIGTRLPSFLRDSWKLFPSVVVTPFETELYVLLLIVCGCWTVLRRGPSSRAGVAAMQMTAIAGLPIVLVGVLMFLGLVGVSIAAPDRAGGSLPDGLTYTYYSALDHRPSALVIVLAPLSKLPEAWIWGALGGNLGRSFLRSRAARSA
jgi:hypothetical protein